MSTDKERMEMLLAHLKMNPNELAKSLGYSRTQRIYFVLSGRNGISSSLARDICSTYKEISFDWLKKGEGDMINVVEHIDIAAIPSLNERILFMINHFCEGNKAEFARMMGEKPQTINGWLNRNNGNGVLVKILNKFPMVNPAWLYTGKGEMIDDESDIRTRDAMAKEVNPYTPVTDESHSRSLMGKLGSAIVGAAAGTALGANMAVAAAMPSAGLGGIVGALFGSIFGKDEELTDDEAIDVLTEALEDAKRTTKENEALKEEIEYWKSKANNLEYQLAKTKAG